jgi:glycine cleavage system protein P-like pyridoxal-binding family
MRQVVLKAYAWSRSMGADGMAEASDLSVHNQAIHRLKTPALDDPSKRTMTWRAYQRKKNAGSA